MDIQNPVFRFEHLQNAASHSLTLGWIPSVCFASMACQGNDGGWSNSSTWWTTSPPKQYGCFTCACVCKLRVWEGNDWSCHFYFFSFLTFCKQFSSGRHFVEVIRFDAGASETTVYLTMGIVLWCCLHYQPMYTYVTSSFLKHVDPFWGRCSAKYCYKMQRPDLIIYPGNPMAAF